MISIIITCSLSNLINLFILFLSFISLINNCFLSLSIKYKLGFLFSINHDIGMVCLLLLFKIIFWELLYISKSLNLLSFFNDIKELKIICRINKLSEQLSTLTLTKLLILCKYNWW